MTTLIKLQSLFDRSDAVEMQISEDLNFDKCAIYYWAKLVTEQLSEGMMFKELRKTISINILDFNFVPGTAVFHNRYKPVKDVYKDEISCLRTRSCKPWLAAFCGRLRNWIACELPFSFSTTPHRRFSIAHSQLNSYILT
jgi:hypothetical protein